MTNFENAAGMKQVVDYAARTDTSPVYLGVAPAGTDEGSNQWLIYKFEYDTYGRMISKKVMRSANWTGRAGYTYA